MKTKNMLLSILFLTMILYSFTAISAADANKLILGGQLEDSKEYEEIQALISKETLFPYMQPMFLQEGISITMEELDQITLKPFKIYQTMSKDGLDHFNPGTKEKDKLIDLMNQEGYAWYIPFRQNDIYMTLAITFTRPLPSDARERMTPEQITRYESKVGHWDFNTVTVSKNGNGRNYREVAEAVMAEREDIKDYVILSARHAGFNMVALGFDETEVKYIIPLDPTNTEFCPPAFRDIVPKEMAIQLTPDQVIYNYDEVAPYGTMVWKNALAYEEEHGLKSGGIPGINELAERLAAEEKKSLNPFLFIGLAVTIAILATGGVILLKRH